MVEGGGGGGGLLEFDSNELVCRLFLFDFGHDQFSYQLDMFLITILIS